MIGRLYMFLGAKIHKCTSHVSVNMHLGTYLTVFCTSGCALDAKTYQICSSEHIVHENVLGTLYINIYMVYGIHIC